MRWAVPGVLAATFGVWCGTFVGGAGALATAVAAGSLLGIATLGEARDPWRLGPGRWLPWALLVQVVASLLVSPVPRAGRTAALLLPAFLLLPAALAPAFALERRRLTRRGLSAAVLLVAGIALYAWASGHSPRPSAPLGHHNLLATFLVALAPLALPFAGESRAWRRAGWTVGAIAAFTVVATRSVAGTAGLATAVLLLATRRRRLAAGLVAAAALAVPLLAEARGAQLVRGLDPSLRARLVYVEGAWRGLVERPWLGWGPGATPWTLAGHLRPEPGISPPGEIVGDAHLLPATIGYELGLPGLLLAVGLGLAVARQPRDRDDEPTRRGRAACAGFAVCALGGAPLAVAALPLALALAVAAAISSSPRGERRTPAAERWLRPLPPLYAAAAAVALAPSLLAGFHYDRALGGPPAVSAQALARAATLDSLPLYDARLAWLSPVDSAPAADRAYAAARRAGWVGALWIAAGHRGVAAGRPWATAALRQACALDPLAAMPPLLLALAHPAADEAPARLALAWTAEPRLAAAAALAADSRLFEDGRREVEGLVAIDAGWRTAFLAATARAAGEATEPTADPLELRLEADVDPLLSLSLHAFRRRPAAATLADVPLDARRLAAVEPLPPAPQSAESRRQLARRAGCG